MSLAQLKEVARQEPENRIVHNNLGVLLCQQGKHAEALAHFKRAVALDDRYIVAKKNLANLQEMLGHFDEAAYLYQCIMNQDPDDVEALSGLGRLGIQASRFDSVRYFFQRVLEVDQTNAEAGKVLEWMSKLEKGGLISISRQNAGATDTSPTMNSRKPEYGGLRAGRR
jgi:Tfp pilus assembly protein PilF